MSSRHFQTVVHPLPRLHRHAFRNSPQPDAARVHSLFRLRSSINEDFRPGIITQLPAAIDSAQNYETIVLKVATAS